ncbi:MAG: DUF3883 domain-containing protein [Bacteroidetes bacterium]|nr:DUF3883 domain-containing protein [Bacteroidota bacterium]
MNLKETADKLFDDSKLTPFRGLSAIAEAEKYLQQAYEGRYFFELIQNVRDANKEKNQDGEIFIKLNGNILSIANTGAEFSTKGIESITTIGQSTKQSQDYIGFKGIGFKSVQEITETPRIITRYGSVYFDRKLTLTKYNDSKLKEEQVPLFYFPHFMEEKLSDDEIKKEVVTIIELPIKENITEEIIIDAFSEIKAKQLILLGNIKSLQFESETTRTQFSINKNPQKRFIEVKEDDNPSIKFRYFTPNNKVVIPKEVIQSLEGKEKDIFSSSSQVDINIVLELAENGQFKPIEDAKLYLFYPLQISSGFRFIIHSYFIVNPERTALRDSHLNNFLLTAIGEFIGKEMLKHLKETKANTNRILCFKRNSDAKINVLYDCVVAELKKQKFVYDTQTQRYFSVTEVIVADGFDKGLFPDGKLGGKQLIYTDDKEVINWLQAEFKVPYLNYEDIAKEIENECKRQLKLKRIKFFQNLYNYVSQQEQLNLTGRKVLLTDHWKLVSSNEDVFYGGGRRNPINLAASIKKQIHFIHKDIKISDFREGKSRTGITEFNTYELVRRLLKLFDKGSVPNTDLLNAIFNLQPIDTKSELEIKEKILLPIKGNIKWLSPLTNPIYFETENLKELYPNGNFIDDNLLKWEGEEINAITKQNFLIKFGVWEIPAVFIADKPTKLYARENRDKLLGTFSGLVSRPYYIRNDRILDEPSKYNHWFTNSIIENWNIYKKFIISSLIPKLQYSSSQSYYERNVNEDYMTVKLSSFIETLSTQKWIVFSGEEEAYSVNEIVGIKYLDFAQPLNQVIRKFLKLLPIDFGLKKDFIDAIGLVHLDGDSIKNFVELLNLIHKKFETRIPVGKDFIDFYNRILGKLVDFFYNNDQTESVTQLRGKYFLSIDDTTKNILWAEANQIFYIDDKPNYDLLPVSIKERVQPHFTNRDKNTFGKIAGKIGKRFSNSIQKELIESDAIQTHTLLSFFSYLPECIALLESSLDIVMNVYFDKLKAIRVFEKEKLEVKISVGDSGEMNIPVNHFLDTESDFDIHLSKANNPNRNKQIAESMSELFVNLLERDLRKFSSDLLRFLNTLDKKEYLKDYDILEERVNEIRDKLNTSELTPNQKFWDAILNAKEICNRENVYINKEVDITTLSAQLKVEEKLIQKIQDNFNFHQTSNTANIPLLIELLNLLSLTLEEVNKNLFPKIDLRDFYKKGLTNLKNKFEKSFNAILHSYLSAQESGKQSNYQDYLDNYKIYFEFTVPLYTLELNIEEYFLETLNTKFNFLRFVKNDLQKDYKAFNPVQIYSTNLTLLKGKLISTEFTNDNLESFLAENKRRSLLYFNEVDFLAENFKEWLKQSAERHKPTEEEEDLEEFLIEFINQTKTDIEEVSTNNVEVPLSTGGTSGGRSGKRFDGGAGEQNKKLIGIVAEMVVFEKLKTLYDNIVWVSKFASKVYKTHPGFNPEGQDGLGYDIEYFDKEGNKYFIEVKGKADNYNVFEISRNEIDKAHQEKEFYKIFFVTQTMNNSQRRIRDLGNLFILDDGEDFFANRKFTAFYRNFEIRFQEQ